MLIQGYFYKEVTLSKLTEKFYYPTLCWAIVTAIYMLQYGFLVIPSVSVQQIKQSFQVGLSDVGLYSAMFLYAWVIVQFPVGILFDRFNSRKLIFWATMLIVIGCVIQGFTKVFWLALFGRIVMGTGGGFAFIGAVYLARCWFSAAMLPIMIGITEGITGLTEIGIPLLFSSSHSDAYRRKLILLMGLIALLLAFLSWLFVRDKPSESESIKEKISVKSDIKIILGNKYLWGLGAYVGLAAMNYIVMGDMWGVKWLRGQFGLDEFDAALMNSMAILGFVVGCPIIGWISRMIQTRILILICMAFEFIFLLLINFGASSIISHTITLFLVGFATGGIILGFDMAHRIVATRHYGLALGFLNMCFGLVGVIFTPVLGYFFTIKLGHSVYKPLLMTSVGAVGVIVAIFIARNFKFEEKRK